MDEDKIKRICVSLAKSKSIINSNFEQCSPFWIPEAIFALLMIYLNDTLQALSGENLRIKFSEDVPDGKDATDLINTMRNAICHIGSPSRYALPGMELSFNVGIGQGVIIQIENIKIENKYADDCIYNYGKYTIYRNRHIRRAIREADATIRSVLSGMKNESHFLRMLGTEV